ncbi:hypothetical protein B0H19DRAFT_1058531 [Mycena capillaripes]|nr:hypothetical protein B0H19DRAFT_1058531 [Mycena capillaripes]
MPPGGSSIDVHLPNYSGPLDSSFCQPCTTDSTTITPVQSLSIVTESGAVYPGLGWQKGFAPLSNRPPDFGNKEETFKYGQKLHGLHERKGENLGDERDGMNHEELSLSLPYSVGLCLSLKSYLCLLMNTNTKNFSTAIRGSMAKSRKPYSTLSVDTSELPDKLSDAAASFEINKFDAAYIKKKCEWKYLVYREQEKGPVHVTFCSKSLAFTVGPHILVIHFGLEGNLHLLPIGDFIQIVSTSQPGPNPNAAKAKCLHSFPLPSRFTTPGSTDSVRTINILAAIVMEEYTIIVCDISRIIRLHVISSTRIFGEHDLAVNSELWRTHLWAAFPSRPDWMKEPDAVLEYLDSWRMSVLESDETTPIMDCLLKANGPAAGVGAHLVIDILFLLAIHLDTPADVLCQDEEMYSSLRDFLPCFMAQ